MKYLAIGSVACLLALSVACTSNSGGGGGAGGGGGGGGGTSADTATNSGSDTKSSTDTAAGTKERTFSGSCTGKDGVCMSQWDVPVDGMDMAKVFASVCKTNEGTYSATVVCSGGTPGCCTLPPQSADGPRVKYCYKVTDGDPDGILKKQCLDGFQGTWE